MSTQKKNPANRAARQSIAEALLELLEEKTLSSISISELTQKAGVSRMTYYRNYSSKEDIFASYLADVIVDYAKDVENLPVYEHFYDISGTSHYFSYVRDHQTFLNALFKCGYGHLLLNTIDDYMMQKWKKSDSTVEYIYTLHAFSGALYSAYIYWSMGGAKESVDFMAMTVCRLFSGGKTGEIRSCQKDERENLFEGICHDPSAGTGG